MVVEWDEGTVEDLLAAADRADEAVKLEVVRGLGVAVERGRRAVVVVVVAVAVAVGGVGLRVC